MFLFQPFSEPIQKILFKAGMFLALLIFPFAILFEKVIAYKLPGCIFLDATGIPCPACGGTRAFFALLNGNLRQSFSYNPIVLYVTIVYLTFIISQSLHQLIKSISAISLCAVHFLLVPIILLVNWIIRFANILIVMEFIPQLHTVYA